MARVFAHRFGDQLPDSDTGRRLLDIALVHIADSDRANPDKSVRDFADEWAPWLDDDEHEAMIDEAFNRRRRRKWKADALAAELELTFADRQQLKIVTIGAIDMNVDARTTRRRSRKNEGRAQRRHAKGAKPRCQSLAQTQPWKKLGIGRTTYFERKKAGILYDVRTVRTNTPPLVRSTVSAGKIDADDAMTREWNGALSTIARIIERQIQSAKRRAPLGRAARSKSQRKRIDEQCSFTRRLQTAD
ncbi:hypothetical protein [Bradyrhizobium macuxiense]|uniref:hypothetical protein n=1 Tax=Bradyrhizobium macuxiense TaxID=1755647 RepID=UPI0010A95EE3|nr:hypothetical protein [Bradyrhizobium macuxiense]